MINQLILRCKNKKDYYITKFIVTFINGGTIAAIPIMASLIISMCVAPWGIPVYSVSFYSVGKRAVFAELFYKHPELYVIIYITYVFILFGLLNCLCLTVGFFEENKYAVILVPFLVYYGSSFIMKYLFGSTASLMTTSGMMLLYKDIAVYVAVQIFIVFVVDLLFFMKIKKDVI